MLEQATNDTASLDLIEVENDGGTLRATVSVRNKVGHKFPSGVSFRRAFLEFSVLDADGRVLWASGRTDGTGVIIDQNQRPIAGERFWKKDCSGRIENLDHQPHYERITAQNQAQIYQELVVAPPPGRDPNDVECGGEDYTQGGLFTTSFLSICGHVKDNRLLPDGFLPLAERTAIARKLGVKDAEKLAVEVGPVGVAASDKDYRRGGGDSLEYAVDLAAVDGEPAYVKATLYSQSTPLLPPGPLLHFGERGHPALVLPGRAPRPGGHPGGGLEARGDDHRPGGAELSSAHDPSPFCGCCAS